MYITCIMDIIIVHIMQLLMQEKCNDDFLFCKEINGKNVKLK